MSTQIAVRLSDELVAFVDDQVKSGVAPSRAAVVSRALMREQRRVAAGRDAAILAAADADPELNSLARFAARTTLYGPELTEWELRTGVATQHSIQGPEGP